MNRRKPSLIKGKLPITVVIDKKGVSSCHPGNYFPGRV
jgi:hypothetical protein